MGSTFRGANPLSALTTEMIMTDTDITAAIAKVLGVAITK
jgi:hypothetical protein